MREAIECKRCGLTTTYTNDVELALWAGRPGCPACTKPEPTEAEEPPDQIEAPESVAKLASWYVGEVEALQRLELLDVLNQDEREDIHAEIRSAARTMLGLDP